MAHASVTELIQHARVIETEAADRLDACVQDGPGFEYRWLSIEPLLPGEDPEAWPRVRVTLIHEDHRWSFVEWSLITGEAVAGKYAAPADAKPIYERRDEALEWAKSAYATFVRTRGQWYPTSAWMGL